MATAIRLDRFAGMIPRVSKRLLPDNTAQDARNVFLQDGELRGLNTPLFIKDLSGVSVSAKRVFRIPDPANVSGDIADDVWMVFTQIDVDIAKGPLINDSFDRYYYSGSKEVSDFAMVNSFGRIKAGDPAYKIGVPAPAAPLTVVPASGTSDIEETRIYLYTYVNDWGEESAPCEPTDPVTGKVDDTWTVSGIEDDPSTLFSGFVDAAKIRIYRTVTGQLTQDFRLVVEDDLSAFSSGQYADTVEPEDVALAETLQSTFYNLPPDDLMNLTALPNGILMGTSGRDIYFCEPYRPHAWPAPYVLTVDYDVKGAAPLGNSAVIMTDSRPYRATGVHSSTMVLSKSDTIAPCVSKRSIVSTDRGVFYASTDGLVAVTLGGMSVVTNSFITRRQWQNDYDASTIFAAQLGLNYIAFTPPTYGGSADDGWAIGLQEPLQRVTTLDKFRDIDGIDTDAWTGDVYLLRGGRVYEWNPTAGIPLDYVWWSKDFVSPRPVNMAAVRFKLEEEGEEVDPGVESRIRDYNTARLGWGLNHLNLAPVNTVYQNWRAAEQAAMAPYPDFPNIKTPAGGSPLIPVVATFEAATLFEVYADNVRVYRGNVFNERLIRLPSGFKAFVWSFRVNSNTTIYSLEVAETGKALMQV